MDYSSRMTTEILIHTSVNHSGSIWTVDSPSITSSAGLIASCLCWLQALINEQCSPELLLYRGELVEDIKEQIDIQVSVDKTSKSREFLFLGTVRMHARTQ